MHHDLDGLVMGPMPENMESIVLSLVEDANTSSHHPSTVLNISDRSLRQMLKHMQYQIFCTPFVPIHIVHFIPKHTFLILYLRIDTKWT